jgi:hypothetical protein
MVHRLALLFGGVGAAGVLALAMGWGNGLLAAAPPSVDTAAAIDHGPQAAVAAPQAPRTVVDKVYVEPTPKPAVVHINKPPRNSAPAVTVRQPSGERDEREPGERDEHGDRGERGERGDD